ncbi:MAG: PaaI family thioesterase [Acidimicrobiia bacterium]
MPLPPDPRTTYDPTDPAEDAPLARKHRLVREAKRLVELVAHLDADDADPAAIDQLSDAVADVAERLDPLPSLHKYGGLALTPGHQGALLERSGISGRCNPLAAPVQWAPDGEILRGWATYSPAYEGPVGHVHGGFVAAAFDDLMGCAQMASGMAGYTGTLTVKMLRPTPLRRRIDYTAGVDRVDGRKIYVWGTSECDGDRLGEAQIVFIAPRTGLPR